MNRLQVAAFYAFTPLNEHQRESLLSDLPDMANTNNVLGSILVAHEGVNGTISGPEAGVEALLQSLRRRLPWAASILQRLEVKRSWADQAVFRRFKARAQKRDRHDGGDEREPKAQRWHLRGSQRLERPR
jgi:UPF0176 protein